MTSEKTWYSNLPAPQAVVEALSVHQLRELLDQGVAGRDFLVVDVRRTDIDEGADKSIIPGALNLPAQTFYHCRETICELLQRVPLVFFHCNSSQGRGPRCAGWYQDILNEKEVTSSKAVVLEGGIKAWKAAYPESLTRW